MKKMKYLKVIIIILCFFYASFSEERRKPIPMEELTGFNSNFYVPHPYPKTRKEIIENITFKLAKISPDSHHSKKTNLLLDTLEGKTSYWVGRILKVKNRNSGYSHDYYWLVLIMNKKREIHLPLLERANGIFTGFTGYKSSFHGSLTRILKTKREILKVLSNKLGKHLNLREVKMDRVAFEKSSIAEIWAPLWEIVLNDGNIYYYSVISGLIHEIEGKIKYDRSMLNIKSFVPKDRDFSVDTITDELLVLKPI